MNVQDRTTGSEISGIKPGHKHSKVKGPSALRSFAVSSGQVELAGWRRDGLA